MADTQIKVTEAASGVNLGAISYTDATSAPVKVGKQHIVDATGAAVDFATATNVQAVATSLGTDGTSPPTITGTGVRGWLRGIYERLTGTLTIGGTVTVANPTAQGLTDAQLRASAIPVTGNLNTTQTGVGTTAGNPFFESVVVAGAAVSAANPLPVLPIASGLAVCAVGTAAQALTVTLPAAGAGLFHHIDAIEITLYSTAARTGSATPVTVSSANLGGYGLTFASAAVIGSVERYALSSDRPVRSAVANTATTITLPAVTGALWRYNVIYSTGA
jgi:hypothetical protein